MISKKRTKDLKSKTTVIYQVFCQLKQYMIVTNETPYKLVIKL